MTEEQAVSKWESEQSFPDIEKIILLSDYFKVTTDYLLKGIEPIADTPKNELDARIFSILGTVLNFIGFVTAIVIWIERQTAISVAIGSVIMAIGCMCFAIGQLMGDNKRKAIYIFGIVNIWFLSIIPISYVFNAIQGISGGYWWTLAPIPQLGNSISAYVMCWIGYFLLCIIFDIAMIKRIKR